MQHCRARLIKWSCPRAVEFRSELPRTRVGKIDFVALAQSDSGQEPATARRLVNDAFSEPERKGSSAISTSA